MRLLFIAILCCLGIRTPADMLFAQGVGFAQGKGQGNQSYAKNLANITGQSTSPAFFTMLTAYHTGLQLHRAGNHKQANEHLAAFIKTTTHSHARDRALALRAISLLRLKEGKSALLTAASIKNSALRSSTLQDIIPQVCNAAKYRVDYAELQEILPKIPVLQRNNHFLAYGLRQAKTNAAYRQHLKTFWIKGGYSKHINTKTQRFKAALEHIERNATLKDWNAHFEGQLALKDYNYIISKAPQVIASFKKKKQYPAYMTIILLKSYLKRRQYAAALRILENKKENRLFALNAKKAREIKLDIYLRQKNFAKADQYLDALANLKNAISAKNLTRLQKRAGDYYYKYAQDYTKSSYWYEKLNHRYLTAVETEATYWQQYFGYLSLKRYEDLAPLYQWYDERNFSLSVYGAHFCYWKLKDQKQRLGIMPKSNPCFPKYINQYYGLLSRKFFPGQGLAEILPNFPSKRIDSRALKSAELADLKWLIFLYSIGETQVADTELAAILGKVKSRKDSSFEKLALLTLVYFERHFLLMNTITRVYANWPQKKSDLEFFLRTSYILAHRNAIQKHERKNGLPPFLSQAVAREESFFHPEIRSPAGALGLMQLMPATAKEVSRRLKRKYSRRNLILPQENVRLGSAYLRTLLKRFKNLHHVLAAYNGGPTNTKKWIQKYQVPDLDYFTENIPFRETRLYVKKVLRSYMWYRLLANTMPNSSGENFDLMITGYE